MVLGVSYLVSPASAAGGSSTTSSPTANCVGMPWSKSVTAWYTNGCVGHDEPTMNFVSNVAGSGENATVNFVLPKSTTGYPQGRLYATFWFGGVVYVPGDLLNQGYLEFQFYPAQPFYTGAGSGANDCQPNGAFFINSASSSLAANQWFACVIVWAINPHTGSEYAAVAEPLNSAGTTDILVMNSGDNITLTYSGVAKSATSGWKLAVHDNTATSGGTDFLANSTMVFPPYYSTADANNTMLWGASNPGAISFAYEIGHSVDNFNCYPGDASTTCLSYYPLLWAKSGQMALSMPHMGTTKSLPQDLAFASSQGGDKELDSSSTSYCTTGLGGTYGPSDSPSIDCMYPYYQYNGTAKAFTFGTTDVAGVTNDFNRSSQFPTTTNTTAPATGDFNKNFVPVLFPQEALTPNNGGGGTPILVTGSNFTASATVSLAFDGATLVPSPSSCLTSAAGTFSCTVTAPTVAAGLHIVSASDGVNSAYLVFNETTAAITTTTTATATSTQTVTSVSTAVVTSTTTLPTTTTVTSVVTSPTTTTVVTSTQTVTTTASTVSTSTATATQTVTSTATSTQTVTSGTTVTVTQPTTTTAVSTTTATSTATSTYTLTSTTTSTVTSTQVLTTVSTSVVTVQPTTTTTTTQPTVTSTATVSTTTTVVSVSTSVVTSSTTQPTTTTVTATVTSPTITTVVTSTQTAVRHSTTTATLVVTEPPSTVTKTSTITGPTSKTTATSTYTYTVTYVSTASLPLPSSGSILVYVYSSGGVPLPDVAVTLSGLSAQTLDTGSNGGVAFAPLQLGQAYTVHATVDGAKLSAPVALSASDSEATVVLEPTPASHMPYYVYSAVVAAIVLALLAALFLYFRKP